MPNQTYSPLRLSFTSLGRLIQIQPSNIHRAFGVHEDLLCATSTVFKKRLQRRRKPISGDCSICSEALDPSIADITFCRASCGQNVHVHCLENWGQANAGVITCPICRKPWQRRSTGILELKSKSAVDPKAMQTYIDWLYTGNIQIDTTVDAGSDASNVCLLRIWSVAKLMGDTKFENAIVALYTAAVECKQNRGFWLNIIWYTFETTGDDVPDMRDLIVYDFLAQVEPGWFGKEKYEYPEDFLRRVGELVSLKFGNDGSRPRLLMAMTDGEFELQADEAHES